MLLRCQWGAWHTQANSQWSTWSHKTQPQPCTHTNTHTHTHRPTQLEADAVLVSVTISELCVAQITAGVKTTEEEGCLYKGENRNKGIKGCKHPLLWKQTKHTAWQRKIINTVKVKSRKTALKKDCNFQLKSLTNTTKRWCSDKLNNFKSAALKTNKHHYRHCVSVSMGVVFLFSSFLVYTQQSTAVMLCIAAHVHPCRVREKGRRGRVGGR